MTELRLSPQAPPPYPNEGTTAAGLLGCLRALRRWVEQHRGPHNERLGREFVPAAAEPPTLEAYSALPVYTQMTHLVFLRKVRERWDCLTRLYGDRWDDENCFRQRVILLTAAASLLQHGFLVREQLEFFRREELDECRRVVDEVHELMRDLVVPEQYYGPDPETFHRRLRQHLDDPPGPAQDDEDRGGDDTPTGLDLSPSL